MGVIWYGLDAKGVASANGTTSNRNLLTARLYWQSLDLDVFGQYFAGSSWGGDLFWPVFAALKEAKKNGGYAIRRSNTAAPMGTVFGIKTMWRAPDFVGSLEPLDVPAYPVRPHSFGGGVTDCDVPPVLAIAPHGFLVRVHVWATYTVIVAVNPIKDYLGRDDLWMHIVDEKFGAPVCQYYHGDKPNPPNYPLFIEVALRTYPGVDPTFEPLVYYRLIHVKKINAEIYPPDQTILSPNSQVHILAEPTADRVLTEFTVQSVDRLEEATKVYPDLSLPGITAPYGYDDGRIARYTHGPVVADVYVTAVAEGVEIEKEIQAGIGQTIQMTTTDCLVEAGSWEIAGSNLPETAIYSISTDGLVSIFIPEDVYDGNPGGRYYIDVQFEGYSQIKTLRVWVTVSSVAAYGTVWTAAGTLPEKPISIFEDSSKTVYITSETNIYTTDDFGTFDVVPLTGTRTGIFGNVAETANGRLVLLEADSWIGANGRIWTKDPGEAGFTRRNDWAGISNGWDKPMWVSGHPDSNVILFGASTSYCASNCLLTARNATTGSVLHTLDVPRGVISGYAMPAVRLDNGDWLISVLGDGVCKIFKYVEGTGFVSVLDDHTSFPTNNILYREADGRVVVIGNESETQWFSRYTTDGGTTWSDKTLLTVTFNNQVCSAQPLKKNYLVVGSITGQISRSTDTLATATLVATGLGAYVGWITKRSTGTLLATVFRKGGTNIYKSEA